MVLQDLANWAAVLGVPLTIFGLIIAYWALKGQISTIGTQINTNFDNITLQLKHQQEQPIIMNFDTSDNAKTSVQITQNYEKRVEEKREDE